MALYEGIPTSIAKVPIGTMSVAVWAVLPSGLWLPAGAFVTGTSGPRSGNVVSTFGLGVAAGSHCTLTNDVQADLLVGGKSLGWLGWWSRSRTRALALATVSSEESGRQGQRSVKEEPSEKEEPSQR